MRAVPIWLRFLVDGRNDLGVTPWFEPERFS
jgi:hypothetical protein